MNTESININNMYTDDMYPEVYHQFMPIIEQVINDMRNEQGTISLDEDTLNRMVDEAIRRSSGTQPTMAGMTDMMDIGEPDGESIQTAAMDFGHGHGYDHGHGHRPDPPPLADIYKILLLQQLLGGRYRGRGRGRGHGHGRR